MRDFRLASKRPSGLVSVASVVVFAFPVMAACGSEAPGAASVPGPPDQDAQPRLVVKSSRMQTPEADPRASGKMHRIEKVGDTPPTPTGRSVSNDPIRDRGRALFTKYCTICHGENGDGTGKFAYLMNPRPRDFTQGNFKLATTRNQIPTEADLVRTIGRGMPGSAMPPWDHLPRADLQALARFVRQFHINGARRELEAWVSDGSISRDDLPEALAERTEPGAPLVLPPEAGFDEIHWFRGRRLYLENCASCHGADGQPVAEAVKLDNEGYPVPPRSFVNGIFKGGSDGHQLYVRIWKGMKGTPMPASEGV